jgi:hypothetical protein
LIDASSTLSHKTFLTLALKVTQNKLERLYLLSVSNLV